MKPSEKGPWSNSLYPDSLADKVEAALLTYLSSATEDLEPFTSSHL